MAALCCATAHGVSQGGKATRPQRILFKADSSADAGSHLDAPLASAVMSSNFERLECVLHDADQGG